VTAVASAISVSVLPEGTVTFLFTDIEGSTRLLKRLGPGYAEVLSEHRRILREAATSRGGREVDTQGDAFFFAFPRASAAVGAAVAAQRALAAYDWPEGGEVRVRMGLHTAEPEVGDEHYVGIGVHRAARIGAVGHGGQVLLSTATKELAEDDLDGVHLRELGSYRLKDIDRPERLYQLYVEGLPRDFPPLKSEKVVERRLWQRRPVIAAAAVVVVAAVAVPIIVLNGHGGHSVDIANMSGDRIGAISLSNNRPIAAVTLPASPSSIAVGDGSVWVTMPDQDAVSRIDPATNTVQQTIKVDAGPSDVVVGDGFVWVANSLAGTVSQINPQVAGGQVVKEIAVGSGPTGIAFGLGAVWVADSADSAVVRIDPRSGVVSKPISVGAGAGTIAVGAGAVWVAAQSAGVVSRIDPRTDDVEQTINVGNGPADIAVAGNSVWVANSAGGTVSRIDAATNDVTGTFPTGPSPSGVATALDGQSIWVSDASAGMLLRVDASSGQIRKAIRVGGQPQAVALSGGEAYVAVEGSGNTHRGGTLTFATVGAPNVYTPGLPKALDPGEGYTSWELLSITNDGLVTYGRTGGAGSSQIVPDLALALPAVSNGGLTYTFTLRPGIHYSTGALVEPADIRRGIERTLLIGRGQPPSSFLADIVGAPACMTKVPHCDLSRGVVTSPGSNTVTIHLRALDPNLLYQLALPIADAVPSTTPLDARLPLPATGPYRVASFDVKTSIVRLVRNPAFHVWSSAAQPAGYPDVIVERYGYTGNSAVKAVEDSTADVTDLDLALPPSVLAALETRYSNRVDTVPLPETVGVWLNNTLAPFNNERVRQALNYAVDRRHLIALAGGPGEAELSCQLLPPNVNGYRRYCPYTENPDAAGTYNGPDLAKAQRLVAASGTKGDPITLWFYDIPIGIKNANYIASVLGKLGYPTRVRRLPHDYGNTYRSNRQAGVGGFGGDYPAASDFLATGFTCATYQPSSEGDNNNDSGFCNHHIDAQMARANALQSANPAASAALWGRIDREITDQAPWLILRNEVTPDFLSARTGDFTYCYLSEGACLDQLWVR
jgi:peptide/nickel transport system substrate-binding protein